MKPFSTQLRILGRQYNFEFTDVDYLMDIDGKSAAGICNHWEQRITLARRHPDKVKAHMVHEIFEAIAEILPIGLSESQIEMLEAGWFQFLKENNIYLLWEEIDESINEERCQNSSRNEERIRCEER